MRRRSESDIRTSFRAGSNINPEWSDHNSSVPSTGLNTLNVRTHLEVVWDACGHIIVPVWTQILSEQHWKDLLLSWRPWTSCSFTVNQKHFYSSQRPVVDLFVAAISTIWWLYNEFHFFSKGVKSIFIGELHTLSIHSALPEEQVMNMDRLLTSRSVTDRESKLLQCWSISMVGGGWLPGSDSAVIPSSKLWSRKNMHRIQH